MTNEELQKEIVLWKRATGYDDPEVLDSFLGRAGVLNQFDVLNKMLADAIKEKEQLRALLDDARAEFRVLASYLDAPEYNFPNAGLYITAKAHKKMVERIDKALEKQNV
jgi:hypothetical protein